jgi:hypothetical protein
VITVWSGRFVSPTTVATTGTGASAVRAQAERNEAGLYVGLFYFLG